MIITGSPFQFGMIDAGKERLSSSYESLYYRIFKHVKSSIVARNPKNRHLSPTDCIKINDDY